MFGAKSHLYRFRPPLTGADVFNFEEKYEIILPTDYRDFLLDCGNGGAGPYFGINKLDEAIDSSFEEDTTFLKSEFSFTESWNWPPGVFEILDGILRPGGVQMSDFFYQKYMQTSEWDIPNEEWRGLKLLAGNIDSGVQKCFSEMFQSNYFGKKVSKGAIKICDYGSNLQFLLVITGPERGNVWFDRRYDYQGLTPVLDEEGNKMDFYSWYMNWVEKGILSV